MASVANSERAIDGFKLDDSSRAEMMEFRIAVEPGVAGAIVPNATEREIEGIVECVGRGDTAEKWEAFEIWDDSFHRRLIAPIHDQLVVCTYEGACTTRYSALNTSLTKVPAPTQDSAGTGASVDRVHQRLSLHRPVSNILTTDSHAPQSESHRASRYERFFSNLLVLTKGVASGSSMGRARSTPENHGVGTTSR